MKFRVYHWFITVVLLAVSISGNAQKEEERELKTFRDRMFYGVGLNMMFGPINYIEVAPHVGYYITKRWRAGVGGFYDYYYKNSALNDISTHLWGGKVCTDFAVINSLSDVMRVHSNMAIFVESDYLALNLDKKYFKSSDVAETGRFWHHTVILGAGLRQPVGKRSAFFIKYLYDLNYISSMPYDNPYLEFGFEF
jgi:hypothetical protein